jgi:hypothetical protein
MSAADPSGLTAIARAPNFNPKHRKTGMHRLSHQSIHYKLLVLLIVAASCLRVLVCFQHNPMDYLFSDMERHWDNGAAFPRGGFDGAWDPIVYQVYVSLLHHLTLDNRLLVALASALLSGLMPWTYYRAARDFGLAKSPALWVWALIAWTPSLFTIYHFIMMETLLLVLEGVALWMTARYLRKGGTSVFLLFIFSWTLASLTKPTVIPLAGVCFLWVWWKKPTPLRDIAIGAALAVVMLLPNAIQTKHELGFMAPFGNPWPHKIVSRAGARVARIHLYTYSDEHRPIRPTVKHSVGEVRSPSAFTQPLAPLSNWAIRRAYVNSTKVVIIHLANGERDWKEAYAAIDADRDELLAQWRENIVLFFFAPSFPEIATEELWDSRLEYFGRWLWAPLILFIFVCNFRQFLARRFELIPVLTTLFTLALALQNVVLMEGRYRKPVEPLLLFNLVWVLGRTSVDRRQREATSNRARDPVAG